jgi:hypothetical protein
VTRPAADEKVKV